MLLCLSVCMCVCITYVHTCVCVRVRAREYTEISVGLVNEQGQSCCRDQSIRQALSLSLSLSLSSLSLSFSFSLSLSNYSLSLLFSLSLSLSLTHTTAAFVHRCGNVQFHLEKEAEAGWRAGEAKATATCQTARSMS